MTKPANPYYHIPIRGYGQSARFLVSSNENGTRMWEALCKVEELANFKARAMERWPDGKSPTHHG